MLGAIAAQAQIEITKDGRRVAGELLVKFRGGTDGAAAERSRATFNHDVHRRFHRTGWQQIRLPRGLTIEEALARYRSHPDVLAVEPNLAGRAVEGLPEFSAASAPGETASGTPNDPQFPNQWALTKIGAPLAWLNQTGSSNMVVAVIDSGVNYYHEDLQDNLWRNPGEVPGNGIDDDGNGKIDDVFGIDTANDSHGNDSDPFDEGLNGYYHGSLVAGVIGAVANNHLGLAGLNWSTRIMAVRAIRSGNVITVGDELEALEYVLLMKNRGVNIRAVNMSYGGISYSTAERDALAAVQNAGILLCISAGNSSGNNDTTPVYPASHPLPGIIAVAASDSSDQLATFLTGRNSNYGRTNVDLAAPGLEIVSTYGPGTNDYRSDFWGTSAAAPHLAGAVALLAAANPAATPPQIKSALLETVDLVPAFTNKMVSHGRLNLGHAMDHPFIANGPPFIGRQPLAQTVVLSNQAAFGAVVFGSKPRAFQWHFNGEPISGATNVTLVISKVSFTNAGEYRLVASNVVGVVTSQVAALTLVPLRITNQPASLAVNQDASAQFRVGVSSPVPLTYQWRFNGTKIAAATNATLTLSRVQLSQEGGYSVVVSNRFGSEISDDASLAVLIDPILIAPPISQSVAQGGSVTFSAGFSGHPPPFGVEWRQGSTTLASNTVAGFADFFLLTNAQPAQAGTWRVTVRNPASSGGVQGSFTLTVLPDSDGDGVPNVWEQAHGLLTNDASDAVLDSDLDGASNRDEYTAGTNPTNAQSVLRIETIQHTNLATMLTFHAASNKTYTVEVRVKAEAEPWFRVADVPAVKTNRTVFILDGDSLSSEAARYYRLVTPRRP